MIGSAVPADTTSNQRKGQQMATTDVAFRQDAGRTDQRIVNNMSIQVATVNGSGSQSSNTVLLRSIFQMGVPVSGNLRHR